MPSGVDSFLGIASHRAGKTGNRRIVHGAQGLRGSRNASERSGLRRCRACRSATPQPGRASASPPQGPFVTHRFSSPYIVSEWKMLPKQHEEECRDQHSQPDKRQDDIYRVAAHPTAYAGPARLLLSFGVVFPHFISHHQSAIPIAVVTVDIPSAAANTFASSQYDTNAIS